MPVIRDPDFLDYGEYNYNTKINPYTASKNNAGQPAQLLIDYDDRKFVLTAPKYGEIGAGNTNLVGYGGTGGVTGQALYSKFKQIWKTDNVAIKFPFPMEAITPESFEFINGWEPDDETEMDWYAFDVGIATGPAITRKLIKDAGWAERTTAAEGSAVKRKYFNIITLGAISKPTEEDSITPKNATIYCSQLNPATRFTFNGSDIISNDRISVTAPMIDMYTGSRVVYQEPTSTPVGIGLTHNNFYYIRFASSSAYAKSGERHGTVGVTTAFRIQFHPTQADALNNTNRIGLTTVAGIASIRHQSDAPNFFFDITEDGGAANEPFLFYYAAGSPDYQPYYNYDNYFKIYNREKARTYAEQAISQVGVTQINYQAYRIPLATSVDSNLQESQSDISDTTLGSGTAPGGDYAGIGVSFHQTSVQYDVSGTPRDFNVTIDANQKGIDKVYQYVQGLLRLPDRVNSAAGLAYTSMNSLSAVGFGTNTVGSRNQYGNDLRVGKTEEPLLEFIGNTLYAKQRSDIYGETTSANATNHGVYIKNVRADQLTDVVYYDNLGETRVEPYVSSYTLVFNTNLNADNDARFWIFYNTDEELPGISTTFDITATGVVGSSDGIDATNNQFVSGNTQGFHPFVNGQEVVAIATVSNPGIGFTCDTLAAGIVTYTIDHEGTAAYELSALPNPSDYANKTYTIGANNPTLYVYAGDTAVFDTSSMPLAEHPFVIKIGNPYDDYIGGTTGYNITGDANTATIQNNGGYDYNDITGTNNTGIVTMIVPVANNKSYYYICAKHESMRGEIKILDKNQDSQWKYYVNAQKTAGVGQTYRDISESGTHVEGVIGVGSTSTFRLHYTYLDAVANAGVGINTIPIQPSNNGNVGIITFTQTDVNYEENNATIVQTSDKQFDFTDGTNVGSAQTYTAPYIFMDGVDVPSSGSYTFTFSYDNNHQRNRKHSQPASAKIVTIGLGGAQYLSQNFSIGREKGITVNISAPLERVYSDPVN